MDLGRVLEVCLIFFFFFFPSFPLVRRQAHLCVLAANCDEPMYVKLVEALCAEHQINLMKVRARSCVLLLTPLVCVCDDNLAPSTESSEEIAFVTQLLLRHTDVLYKNVFCLRAEFSQQ